MSEDYGLSGFSMMPLLMALEEIGRPQLRQGPLPMGRVPTFHIIAEKPIGKRKARRQRGKARP